MNRDPFAGPFKSPHDFELPPGKMPYNSQRPFQLGDVVWLAHGGVKMTVVMSQNDTIDTRWFNSNNELQSGAFPAAALTLVCDKEGNR